MRVILLNAWCLGVEGVKSNEQGPCAGAIGQEVSDESPYLKLPGIPSMCREYWQ